MHLSQIAQKWVSNVLLLGSILFLLLGSMDFFLVPFKFKTFMTYRLLISAMLILLYHVNKLKTGKLYQYLVIVCATTLSAVAIEVMVLESGGQHSVYYAGLNLVAICALGFIPIDLALSTVVLVLIYGIYVLPIALRESISDPVFISNNFFMIATFIIALVWRQQNQKLIVNEFNLREELAQEKQKLEQYSGDLEQQRKQLEVYSRQLKGMVEDRTIELRKSEQWHRAVFENASDGIIIVDRNGIIMNVNEKACAMHGFTREALTGTHVKLLEDSGSKDGIVERMRRILDGEALVYEAVHNKKDGTLIYLEISSTTIEIGEELFIQSFYRDITEKKKIQQHLFQSQKMESVGVLAGGIAHDLNNILTAVLGHTHIVRLSENLNEKAIRSLNVIEDAARRAGQMISKLLGFARKSNYQIVPINVNDVVYDTVKLLEQIIDRSITIRVELDGDLPFIQGDINHLQQVLMNLIVNARDAMPEGGGITIKAVAREVKKGEDDVPLYVPAGRYIRLSVADTGIGIPEHLLSTIFEPFFTTKERGKGTGLGLSMVYGAVKEHKGYIMVQSKIGEGSTFIVYLPVFQPASPRKEKPAYAAVTGTETIFVVDDEEQILHSMEESLRSHGYRLIAASDPVNAVDMFRRLPQNIDLLITDIVMPGIDGKELIRQFKQNKPDVKVLAVSGYTKYVADKQDITTIDGFLHKPFETGQLLTAVRKVLDAKTPDFITI